MPSTKDFIIRQNGQPMKVLRMEVRRVTAYMHRLQARFPDHRWSVCDRFPIAGSD